MRKIIALVLIATVFVSCKSKQKVFGEKGANEAKTVVEIIKGHYANEKDFNKLYIKAKVRYSDKYTSQRLSADIRVSKDKKILVSLKFLGITMAKALITPEKVSYYEKLNHTYFEGDYAMLSRWLGADLDYTKVQNLLLGNALYDLKEDTYTAKIDNEFYNLESNSKGIVKTFSFEGANYLLKKENIQQGKGIEIRSLSVAYPEHVEYPEAILPASINIEAVQKDKVTIDIDYNTVTFDKDFSFPYKVPSGFDQIFLD
ncbi:DUF4292 domain-containing protein [uncultured Flavobacterium sp.]|uniref:DUF4292 domain-containing protein n=1 Tax=uncultured Flavobacterium sp. TaxID=165435 RepID=UPI0025E3B1D0|nr:DUF4292 domain-containing protein [uncultured Flavobacterium sp.]